MTTAVARGFPRGSLARGICVKSATPTRPPPRGRGGGVRAPLPARSDGGGWEGVSLSKRCPDGRSPCGTLALPRPIPLREDPALAVRLRDPPQGQAHRGGTPVALAVGGVLRHRQIRALHALGEALLDLLEIPHLRALVLQPLVVADADAAGVGQDVGDDVNAL